LEDVLGQIRLLGQFELRVHDLVLTLSLDAQRLLVLLALGGAMVRRPLLAGTLWPEKGDDRAVANLRSSLWRVGQASPDLISSTDGCLALGPSVHVDTTEMLAKAQRLQDRRNECIDADLDVSSFQEDLLPGWCDDWILFERERIRQVRLHALEALCERLVAEGRYAEAIDAALAAVAAEPLRESAHLALIRAYEAEGNLGEALRAYENLRGLLWRELAVEPSSRIEAFVRSIRATPLNS
jgi:DNA-binding SARP family transcriptional activator